MIFLECDAAVLFPPVSRWMQRSMKVRAATICRVPWQERPCVAAEAKSWSLRISPEGCKYRIDGPLRLNPLPGAAPGAALLGIQSRFRAKSTVMLRQGGTRFSMTAHAPALLVGLCQIG